MALQASFGRLLVSHFSYGVRIKKGNDMRNSNTFGIQLLRGVPTKQPTQGLFMRGLQSINAEPKSP